MVLIDVPVDLSCDPVALQRICVLIKNQRIVPVIVDEEVLQVLQIGKAGTASVVAEIKRGREFVFLPLIVQEEEKLLSPSL